jgi:hypothetical protein
MAETCSEMHLHSCQVLFKGTGWFLLVPTIVVSLLQYQHKTILDRLIPGQNFKINKNKKSRRCNVTSSLC